MGRLQKFFPFCWLLDHSNDSLFAVQNLLSLIRSHLSILAFVAIAFGVLVMKSLHLLKIVLAMQALFWFHMKFRYFFSNSVRKVIGALW